VLSVELVPKSSSNNAYPLAFILGQVIFWVSISIAVGCNLPSTGFAGNCSLPTCADVSHDSGMDTGHSQTGPHTSKTQRLRDRYHIDLNSNLPRLTR